MLQWALLCPTWTQIQPLQRITGHDPNLMVDEPQAGPRSLQGLVRLKEGSPQSANTTTQSTTLPPKPLPIVYPICSGTFLPLAVHQGAQAMTGHPCHHKNGTCVLICLVLCLHPDDVLSPRHFIPSTPPPHPCGWAPCTHRVGALLFIADAPTSYMSRKPPPT